MMARGHRPRTDSETDWSHVVGGVKGGIGSAGVGQYTLMASTDPAELVGFDLQLEEWLASGMIGYTASMAEYREGRS